MTDTNDFKRLADELAKVEIVCGPNMSDKIAACKPVQDAIDILTTLANATADEPERQETYYSGSSIFDRARVQTSAEYADWQRIGRLRAELRVKELEQQVHSLSTDNVSAATQIEARDNRIDDDTETCNKMCTKLGMLRKENEQLKHQLAYAQRKEKEHWAALCELSKHFNNPCLQPADDESFSQALVRYAIVQQGGGT